VPLPGEQRPQTARNATTPAAAIVALDAPAASITSTTIAAARTASTVATIVGVFTRKWIHSRSRVGWRSM
jgi:hypothetical protein